MKRAQDGDEHAYRYLLFSIIPTIKKVAMYKVSDQILIDDIVQDTLISIHKLRYTYNPDQPFLPWLSVITSARAIDILRKYGRHWHKEVIDEDLLISIIDEQYHQDEINQELEEYLQHLTSQQKHIVELVKLKNMSLKEASSHTGLSIPAIKSLLHRAMNKLRKKADQLK